MSTLTLEAPANSHVKFGGFRRLAKSMFALLDVIVEAQGLANEARRRFPFLAW